MKKSRILRNFKEVKKNAVPVLINSSITGVSYLGAKAATNKLAPKITNENLRKVVGPGKIVLGMVIEAFVDEPKIAAIGRGIAVSGFDTTAEDFIPADTKEKIGLAGASNGVNANANNQFDWEAAAREAEEEAAADESAEVNEEAPVSGAPKDDLASKAMN